MIGYVLRYILFAIYDNGRPSTMFSGVYDMTEFTALYESFPCIWRIKSKEYSDRDKKRQAYEILVEKYKEIDATATRETVVKKINSLRSVYRKEVAKVNNSCRSGAGEYDIYKPSLWYFDLLYFLKGQETPRSSRNTMDEDEESTIGETPEQELKEDGHESEADARPSGASVTPISEPPTPTFGSKSGSCNTSRPPSSARKRKEVPSADGTAEVMALVGKKLESLQSEDAFQVFGKYVGNKLRNVDKHQNTIAQKLISDILFEAEMGSLTRHVQIVDMSSRRQDDFGLASEQNKYQENMPRQWNMPHTVSSQVGQYKSFSQPMLRHYVPEQPTHTQEYQTIGQMQQVSSHIIPETHQIPQHFTPNQTETLSEDTSHHDRSSAAKFFTTFQAN